MKTSLLFASIAAVATLAACGRPASPPPPPPSASPAPAQTPAPVPAPAPAEKKDETKK